VDCKAKRASALKNSVCGRKAGQLDAVLAFRASWRALKAIFSDTSPSSLFLSLGLCSAPPANQFAGSGNNAILRSIAENRTLVMCPSASISQ
jgi:hypothetical protein